MLNKIKELSKDNNLIVVPVGVGSAFSYKNIQSSFLIVKNEVVILMDAGTTVPKELHDKGINFSDIDYHLNSHQHADHAGGYEQILLTNRYVYKTKPKFIITQDYQRLLWDCSLRGGMEWNESGMLRFSDFVEPVRPSWVTEQPREMYEIYIPANTKDIYIKMFRTKHIPGNVMLWESAFWSTGVLLDKSILISGDTRFDPEIFDDLHVRSLMPLIFHDCQLFSPGTVHASYSELCTLPLELKNEMYLYHYGDNFNDFTPENDGFRGFLKPWVAYSADEEPIGLL